MAKETVEQWIREALTDDQKDGKCTAITLVHMVGQSEREVDTVKFGGRKWTEKELAARFRGKAENYSADLSGIQIFWLQAFYSDRGEPQARKPFRVAPSVSQENAEHGVTEPPTKEGMIAQAMRHSEAAMTMLCRQTGVLFAAMTGEMQSMRADRANMMRENTDAWGIVKEVVLERATNTHAMRMKELEHQRSTEERKQWLAFGPALINTLVGREVFPVASQDTALIESIAEALTEDDLQKIAASGVLKPTILGPLTARMTDHIRKKRLALEEQNRVLESDMQSLANQKKPHANGADHSEEQLDRPDVIEHTEVI